MDSFTPIALDMAKVIKQYLSVDGEREFIEKTEWKLPGNGFGVNEDISN